MGLLADLLQPLYRGWALTVLLAAVAYSFVLSPYYAKQAALSCSLHDFKDFVLVSSRVVTPNGVIPAAITVRDGVITAVLEGTAAGSRPSGLPVLDYGDAVISPGLVDVHVHLNEPGREEWEGFVTGTRAAAAGGVTALVDMPLNSYPTTTTIEAFAMKYKAAESKIMVDVGFWAGLVPENANDPHQLQRLVDAGVLGFKSFMCPSGINDFPHTNSSHFESALPVLAKAKLPLLIHSEVVLPEPDSSAPASHPSSSSSSNSDDSSEVASSSDAEEGATIRPVVGSEGSFDDGAGSLGGTEAEKSDGDPRVYATYEASRPPTMEREAIAHVLRVAQKTAVGQPWEGARLHIVHLADGLSVPTIQAAKAAGAAVTVETCPHYLAFGSTDVAPGDTRFKCAPPIRSDSNRRMLWQALMDGGIDMLSSDHSPSHPSLKNLDTGNFLTAWGGIAGLQLSLPVTWTHGQVFNVSLMQLARWWSEAPAQLAGLHSKGAIAPGKDADLVVWDPQASFTVGVDVQVFHRHAVTPYNSSTLQGRIMGTIITSAVVTGIVLTLPTTSSFVTRAIRASTTRPAEGAPVANFGETVRAESQRQWGEAEDGTIRRGESAGAEAQDGNAQEKEHTQNDPNLQREDDGAGGSGEAGGVESEEGEEAGGEAGMIMEADAGAEDAARMAANLTVWEEDSWDGVQMIVHIKEHTLPACLLVLCQAQAYAALQRMQLGVLWDTRLSYLLPRVHLRDLFLPPNLPLRTRLPPGWAGVQGGKVVAERGGKKEEFQSLRRHGVRPCLHAVGVERCYRGLQPTRHIKRLLARENIKRTRASAAVLIEDPRYSRMRVPSCSTHTPLSACTVRRLLASYLSHPAIDFTVAAATVPAHAVIAADSFHPSRAPHLPFAALVRGLDCAPFEGMPGGWEARLGADWSLRRKGKSEHELTLAEAVRCNQFLAAELLLLTEAPSLLYSFPSPAVNLIMARAVARTPSFHLMPPSLCAAPCPPPLLQQKFAEHMIVDEELKVAYCALPKVANTSWKLWFRLFRVKGNATAAFGVPDDTNATASAAAGAAGAAESGGAAAAGGGGGGGGEGGLKLSAREFKAIHVSEGNGITELSELGEREAVRFLSRRDVLRFTFVRNPYTRVASAFLDKVVKARDFLNNGSARLYWAKALFSRAPQYSRLMALHPDGNFSFPEFVQLTEEALQHPPTDNHIDTQVELCALDWIKYDFVGRFESMMEGVQWVMQRLGTEQYGVFDSGHTLQATDADKRIARLYDKATFDIVTRAYARDRYIPFNNIVYEAPKLLGRISSTA
ncbi:unnamed protein product [Closterium sp. NIES-53]